MEDKTFAQTLEELNQCALKDITDEVLSCWTTIQQGRLWPVRQHIENEYMRVVVSQVLFYVLLQSLLFDARQQQMIDRKRYEEFRGYIDTLTNQVKQQPFMALLLPTA